MYNALVVLAMLVIKSSYLSTCTCTSNVYTTLLVCSVYPCVSVPLADYDEIDRTLDTMSVVQSTQGLGATLSSKTRSISVVDEIPR